MENLPRNTHSVEDVILETMATSGQQNSDKTNFGGALHSTLCFQITA